MFRGCLFDALNKTISNLFYSLIEKIICGTRYYMINPFIVSFISRSLYTVENYRPRTIRATPARGHAFNITLHVAYESFRLSNSTNKR